jgi:hypothetical protein
MCPHCGQPLPTKRFGIAMSALKARVIDLIQSGGEDGILTETVWQRIFQPRHATRNTMKSHVWQINEMLADEGYSIVVTRDDDDDNSYRIVKRRRAA